MTTDKKTPVTFFCMKEKAPRETTDYEIDKTNAQKTDRGLAVGVRAKCPKCGTGMYKFVVIDTNERVLPPKTAAEVARDNAKRLEKLKQRKTDGTLPAKKKTTVNKAISKKSKKSGTKRKTGSDEVPQYPGVTGGDCGCPKRGGAQRSRKSKK